MILWLVFYCCKNHFAVRNLEVCGTFMFSVCLPVPAILSSSCPWGHGQGHVGGGEGKGGRGIPRLDKGTPIPRRDQERPRVPRL